MSLLGHSLVVFSLKKYPLVTHDRALRLDWDSRGRDEIAEAVAAGSAFIIARNGSLSLLVSHGNYLCNLAMTNDAK